MVVTLINVPGAVAIMAFSWVRKPSLLGLILKLAGCTAALLLCRLIDSQHQALFGGDDIGLEWLLLNGVLTVVGLRAISSRNAA